MKPDRARATESTHGRQLALRQTALDPGSLPEQAVCARKAAGDVVDSIIGTSGTTAACDSVWQLQRMSTGEASLGLKGRELEEALYGLKFNTGVPFGWHVTGEGAEVGMSERRELLLVLQQEGAKKPTDIARLLGIRTSTPRGG